MIVDDKIYPTIPSSAPLDAIEVYRLKKIDEFEQFLHDEVIYRDKLSKRCRRRQTAVTISDTSIVTAITCLSIASFSTMTTGMGMPLSIVLASVDLGLSLRSAIMHKTQKIFDTKSSKHQRIKTLAESKLDSISAIHSEAIQDENISHQEYQFILREIEQYRLPKDQIRIKYKRITTAITEEQREATLQKGRE